MRKAHLFLSPEHLLPHYYIEAPTDRQLAHRSGLKKNSARQLVCCLLPAQAASAAVARSAIHKKDPQWLQQIMSERDSAVAGAPGSLLLGRGRFVGVGAHLRKSSPRLLLNQPELSSTSMRKCANMAIGVGDNKDSNGHTHTFTSSRCPSQWQTLFNTFSSQVTFKSIPVVQE